MKSLFRFVALLPAIFLVSGCVTIEYTPMSEYTPPSGAELSTDDVVNGEYTIIVTSHMTQSDNISDLYDLAYGKASQKCNEYEEIYTKYYTGEEATSKFMGLGVPWIKLMIQCPVGNNNSASGISSLVIDELTRDYQFSNYFDIHSEEFYADFETTLSAVVKTLKNQGDPIYDIDEERGIITTGRARHGLLGFPVYNQYFIAIDDDGEKSKITFKLITLVREMRDKKLTELVFIPSDRKYSHRRAAEFIDNLQKELKKK